MAGQWVRVLFSISRVRRHPSAPPTPAVPAFVLSCVDLLSGYFATYPFPPSLPVGSDVCAPGLLGVNCSSIDGKWGQLVAYMVLHDLDFICLQELWVDLDPARLVGLPYRVFSGEIFRPGGAAASTAGGLGESTSVAGTACARCVRPP